MFWVIIVPVYIVIGLIVGGFVEAWVGRESAHRFGWFIWAIVTWPICIIMVFAALFIELGHKLCESLRENKDKEDGWE